MKKILDGEGTWFKGNLHTHTTNSDGNVSPEAAIEMYRTAGYDFLALTDHWVQSETAFSDGLLLLSGCEWDCGDMVHTPVFHIIGIGMEAKADLTRFPSLTPQEIIDAVRSAGGLPVLAHPAWSVTDPADVLALKGLESIEIYNTISNLPWNGCRADSGLYFDLWANKGRLFRCMAADDCHFYNGDQTRSYIMVKAQDLTADSLKKAMAAGNFYASQGPRFRSIACNGDVIEVGCSEVESIVFYSNTVWCKDRVTTGGVHSATYKIKPTDRFVRVELVDKNGNMAWSSPFAVND